MQQAVQTAVSPLERNLKVSVPVQQIEAEIGTRLKELARTVKMEGFRPGKVPLKMVERHYGFQVRQEVLSDSVQKSFIEAVKSQNFRVAGYPRFQPVSDAAADRVEFNATFEVYPEIVVGDLSSARVARPRTEVGEKDVDATIETLRRQRAPFAPVERAAQLGDMVNIDFDGRIGGAPFEGGEGRNFGVVLGEGRMLPDFEKPLSGMKAGEKKTVEFTFPQDYAEAVKGKLVEFTITMNHVNEPRLPAVDEAFARSLGVESGDVAKMRAEIRANIERETRKKIQAKLKEQVMDGLLAASSFEVPRALVDAEIERLREQATADLKGRGLTTDGAVLPAELFADRAARRVKLGLLIADLVKKNALIARPEQVRAVITEHAETFEQPEQMVRWFYSQPERLAEIEAVVMEDNVVEWATSKMQVVEEPVAFEDLMGTRKAA
jgi:trigger factor